MAEAATALQEKGAGFELAQGEVLGMPVRLVVAPPVYSVRPQESIASATSLEREDPEIPFLEQSSPNRYVRRALSTTAIVLGCAVALSGCQGDKSKGGNKSKAPSVIEEEAKCNAYPIGLEKNTPTHIKVVSGGYSADFGYFKYRSLEKSEGGPGKRVIHADTAQGKYSRFKESGKIPLGRKKKAWLTAGNLQGPRISPHCRLTN